MSWTNRVMVNLAALQHNVRLAIGHAEGRAVIAVMKANAYGLGLHGCARAVIEAGAQVIAVASLGEADAVRRVVPQAEVLVLGSPMPWERAGLVSSGYAVQVSSLAEAEAFAHLAYPNFPARLHASLDGGMGRHGASPAEFLVLVRYIRQQAGLRLAGVCCHYPQASDASLSQVQETQFTECLSALWPLPADCLVHHSNSEGLLMRPFGLCNAVRVGLWLTGCVPRGCADPGLLPVLTWWARVRLVKRMRCGQWLDDLYCAPRDLRIAVISLGYADGYPRAAEGRGEVLICGQRCPLLGRIGMEDMVADVTALPALQCGELVTLLGTQEGQRIGVNELAEAARTIPYEILCGISR